MASSRKEGLLAFSFYLLAGVVMTWPLLTRLTTHVPLGTNDLWQNYWNLWWWKRSLLAGQSPYYTELLFHPDGAPLGLHTHSPATMLSTLPVNLLLGPAAAYNAAVLIGFVMAGFGGYLLAREYTRTAGAALLAGIVTSYFPQHVERSLEHINLASYWAMPLLLWSLVRLVRRGGRWWAATGCLFALNALFAWHNGLMSIPLAAALVVFETWRGSQPVRRVAGELGKASLLALLLLAPFAWPLIRDSRAAVAPIQRSFPDRSIDPVALVVPHSGHPLWGPALTDLKLEIRRYRAVGFEGYVGLTALALFVAAGLTALLRGRQTRGRTGTDPPAGSLALWILLSLFFLVLSFGETLTSSLYTSPEWLLLPFHWLRSLPLFGLVRLPNRFFVPAMVAGAVALGIAADSLLRRFPPPRRSLVAGAFTLLLLLDYAWLPFPTRELPPAEWVSALADLPADLPVLDISTAHRGAGGIDMYLQTLHQHPIVGGYVSANLRTTARRFRDHPQLRRVFKPFGDPEALKNERPTLVESIRLLDAGVVVVHLERTRLGEIEARKAESRDAANFLYRLRLYDPQKEIPAADLAQVRAELRDAFGAPMYRDEAVEIYLVEGPRN